MSLWPFINLSKYTNIQLLPNQFATVIKQLDNTISLASKKQLMLLIIKLKQNYNVSNVDLRQTRCYLTIIVIKWTVTT